MSTVKRVLVAEGKDLEPGQSKHWWWNHAQPETGVFALSVWPVISFQNNTSIDKLPATAEVRNISYKFTKAIANVQSSELEIHYDVHNVGDHRIDYHVFMSVVD